MSMRMSSQADAERAKYATMPSCTLEGLMEIDVHILGVVNATPRVCEHICDTSSSNGI